jgi:transcriptional regulator with XRE-family HTH domain
MGVWPGLFPDRITCSMAGPVEDKNAWAGDAVRGEGRHGFAELLQAYRARAQLTQEELAGRTHLSVRALRDLESGRTVHPRRDSVRRLAASLGLTQEESLEFEVSAGAPPRAAPDINPSVPPSPSIPAPNQAPPNIADFTGRDVTVARLRQLLLDAGAERPPVVVTIDGKTGVGKTTLAVNVAHLVHDHFPDGQLFVDLGATRASPLDPSQVLTRFLRALGVDPTLLPTELEELANLFRSLVADRRMLLILDDAASEEQVRPKRRRPGCVSDHPRSRRGSRRDP